METWLRHLFNRPSIYERESFLGVRVAVAVEF